MKNDSTPQVSAGAPSPGVGSSDLLGVLDEIAKEMRACESQCIHAEKAKAMYARRAEKIEAALKEIRALTPTNMASDHWSKEYGLKPDDVFEICDRALSSPNTAISREGA